MRTALQAQAQAYIFVDLEIVDAMPSLVEVSVCRKKCGYAEQDKLLSFAMYVISIETQVLLQVEELKVMEVLHGSSMWSSDYIVVLSLGGFKRHSSCEL